MGSEESPRTVLLSDSWPFLRLKLQTSALPPLDTSGFLNADRQREAKRAQLTDPLLSTRWTGSMISARAVHHLKTKVNKMRLRGRPNNTE